MCDASSPARAPSPLLPSPPPLSSPFSPSPLLSACLASLSLSSPFSHSPLLSTHPTSLSLSVSVFVSFPSLCRLHLRFCPASASTSLSDSASLSLSFPSPSPSPFPLCAGSASVPPLPPSPSPTSASSPSLLPSPFPPRASSMTRNRTNEELLIGRTTVTTLPFGSHRLYLLRSSLHVRVTLHIGLSALSPDTEEVLHHCTVVLRAAAAGDLGIKHLEDSLLDDGGKDPLENVGDTLAMVEVLRGERVGEDLEDDDVEIVDVEFEGEMAILEALGRLVGEYGVGGFDGLNEREEAEVGEEGLEIGAEEDVSIFLQPAPLSLSLPSPSPSSSPSSSPIESFQPLI